MEQNIEQENVTEIQSPKSRKKKWIFWGCLGSIVIPITLFGMLVAAYYTFSTPEEREKYEMQAAEKQRLRKIENEKQAMLRQEEKQRKEEEARIAAEEKAKIAAEAKAKKEKEAQLKRAEKQKPEAYAASQRFIKDQLKYPESAKFTDFSELNPEQIVFVRENEFVILCTCRARNSFYAYEAQNYGVWVEYCDNRKWKCKALGDQEHIIRRAMPELAKLADEEKARQDALDLIERKKRDERTKKEEAQKRFEQWKSKIASYKKGRRLSMACWYYIPADMALYQNKDCTTVMTQLSSGQVFKLERPYSAKASSIRVTIYLFNEGIRPEKPSYEGFLKMKDLAGDISADQIVNSN